MSSNELMIHPGAHDAQKNGLSRFNGLTFQVLYFCV